MKETFEIHIRGLTDIQKQSIEVGKILTGASSINQFLLDILLPQLAPYEKVLIDTLNHMENKEK